MSVSVHLTELRYFSLYKYFYDYRFNFSCVRITSVRIISVILSNAGQPTGFQPTIFGWQNHWIRQFCSDKTNQTITKLSYFSKPVIVWNSEGSTKILKFCHLRTHNLRKFPQIYAVSTGVVLAIMGILCIIFKSLLLSQSQSPSLVETRICKLVVGALFHATQKWRCHPTGG